jgi:hypothetical protein
VNVNANEMTIRDLRLRPFCLCVSVRLKRKGLLNIHGKQKSKRKSNKQNDIIMSRRFKSQSEP